MPKSTKSHKNQYATNVASIISVLALVLAITTQALADDPNSPWGGPIVPLKINPFGDAEIQSANPPPSDSYIFRDGRALEHKDYGSFSMCELSVDEAVADFEKNGIGATVLHYNKAREIYIVVVGETDKHKSTYLTCIGNYKTIEVRDR